MDTAGCLTLRYKDGVCDLGGFYAFNDGPDSEMCFLNYISFYGGSVSNIFTFIFWLILMVPYSESTIAPSYGVITTLPGWGPGYEISFEFYLNSDGGTSDYQQLFGVVGNADHTADDVGEGQPVIFYRNGKLPIWFAINGHKYGKNEAGDCWAGDTLGIWKHPYGGSVTIDVNKWHQVTLASFKEDGKVCIFAAIFKILNIYP